ncbi:MULTISPECIES: LytR/AlgR family response regulator transcription factor [Roseivirga]|jgi:DNA-binding LytR/AlgR family response regulator|uniref:LytR/AlgR family response regulator transcription factor n=1 Tax=Roseivirga TaxID=290180 RepID=UPI001B00E9FC|nr:MULTISPECIES: LytTR family DNA-binding domain-containing protein [Roseivirga]MBO6661260.1 response regulator transcription factor [Roseivirga sp.]MBO6762575.1 response regulator transcription factor [Roseivirga sp.]MBO6908756.1 response regulator transcription factor [Roseivirga sp.]WPZ11656.1 LytTR family DNA-binding domain-containing protein [Roseivirga spongicola]
MKVLIVEDESMAAKRLTNLLLKLEPDIEILDQLDSVKTAVKWLSNNQADLLFFDIQLADGLSFEILNQVNIQTPIIFTTAFDEYAIKAFKVNSIDYLLKPIDPEELKHALEKFHQNFRQPEPQQPNMAMLEQAMKMLTKQYKERFVVKIGEHIHTIPVSDTAYFFSQDKATFLVTEEKKRYIIDYTLEEVEGLIDPQDFFRINRKYLVSMRAVKDIVSYTNSRLRIILHQSDEMDAIVSRERVQDFKKWLDR